MNKMNIDLQKYCFPYSCYLNLTSKCNLRCSHCFGSYSLEIDNELNLAQWKEVVDDLEKSKIFFINISGGEPTQSPCFKEFIRYISKKGIHFILTTNGVFSQELRNFIIENKEYLIGIKVSLDGPDEQSHCFLRKDANYKYNPQIFRITMENIFYFKKQKIPLTIATVLHKGNIIKIDQFMNLIKKINPISWFISPIVLVGRGEQNKEIAEFYEFFDITFWNSLKKKARDNGININFVDLPVQTGEKRLSSYECTATLNFCEIHSDGMISPCSLARVCIPKNKIKFDNIKKKSLKEIWDGGAFNKFRSYMDKGCSGCKLLSKCNKCIAQSFKYFGDGTSPTPFCIKLGKKLGLKNYEKYQDILKNKFNLKI